jgi:hypothetical protein
MAKENDAPQDSVPPSKPESARGFGAMPAEIRRELGRRGGKLAHELGTANRFDASTASAAGRIPHERGTARRWSPEEAKEAWRKSIEVRRRRRAERLALSGKAG